MITNDLPSPAKTPEARRRVSFRFLVKAFVAIVAFGSMALAMLGSDDDTPPAAGQQHWQRDN
ncbi:hypothetical protein [Robbsia sp. KACC 23696]|uniref:hypothetical protein n=1 Tax=Robbsia sp. KACC 23696 TaxID=3149231 RepID=UPI00325C1323